MRRRLGHAPWWVLAIPSGVLFAAGLAVLPPLEQGRHPRVLDMAAAVVGGVAFGVLMGRRAVRQRDSAHAAVGELDDGRQRLVGRAAFRGPVPTDPEVRAAASRLNAFHSDTMRRQRRWALMVFAVLIAITVVNALQRSAWWWAAAAFFAALLIGNLVVPRRLERRLRELDRDPPG